MANEDGHAVACAACCRQPRSDPRTGRAGEQARGGQCRDPEAAADGVHRRLGLGQDVSFIEAGDLADAIDDADRTKYRRYSATYVDPMVSASAQDATLKLVPLSAS
jgi:Uncharacterized protein conserved in bacteria (DUF2255)